MLNIGLLEDCHHGSFKTELLDFNTQLILDACTFEVSVLLLPALHGTAALFYCPTMVYVYCHTAAHIIVTLWCMYISYSCYAIVFLRPRCMFVTQSSAIFHTALLLSQQGVYVYCYILLLQCDIHLKNKNK